MNANEISLYFGNDEKEINRIIETLESNNVAYRFEEDSSNPILSPDENPYIYIFINSYDMEKAQNLLSEIVNISSNINKNIDNNSATLEELLEDKFNNEPQKIEQEKENMPDKEDIIIFTIISLVLTGIFIFIVLILK